MIEPLSYRQLTKDLTDALEPPVWPQEAVAADFSAGRDLQAIHALLAATYADREQSFPPWPAWRDALVSDPEYSAEAIFLARARDGRLAGVCHCWSGAFVKDLAVSPAFRRRGIGKALMLRCFHHFKALGAGSVELKVQKANSCAESLYRSLGMTEKP